MEEQKSDTGHAAAPDDEAAPMECEDGSTAGEEGQPGDGKDLAQLPVGEETAVEKGCGKNGEDKTGSLEKDAIFPNEQEGKQEQVQEQGQEQQEGKGDQELGNEIEGPSSLERKDWTDSDTAKPEDAGNVQEPLSVQQNSADMELKSDADGQSSPKLVPKQKDDDEEMKDINELADNTSNTNEKDQPSEAEQVTKEKTELEREMELYEAAEREEAEMLLKSSQVKDSATKGETSQNEKKRSHDAPAHEGRKKRGKKAAIVKSSIRKEEDDVCFVCYDGGDLVLCDQRSCPKAYHLSCIGRDAEFFRKKGNWHCGWHFCCGFNCSKKASIRCHACPKAYCASCRRQHDFLPLGKRKGLCEECVPLVTMIERNESVLPNGTPVDFNDQETYECLFKEYWENVKAKESIKLPEFDKDGKFVGFVAANTANTAESDEASDNEGSSSESEALGTVAAADDEDVPLGTGKRKERKTKVLNALSDEVKCTINQEQKEEPIMEDVEEKEDKEEEEEDEEEEEEEEEEGEPYKPTQFDGWASQELIAFIKFMKEDPEKPMKRFGVNKLLWDHIKAQKLQNPRKKTIIRCDEQLRALFGKKTISQRGMMKYLHYHFPSKTTKKSQAQIPNEPVKEDSDDEKGKAKSKLKKKTSGRPESNEYAAINQANISLVYLRRALLEDMLGDLQFDQKVLGTFVRIRVPGMVSRNEMCYRLVQVVGTRVQPEEYKAGKKTTNIVLQIMNLHKKEDLTVDLVSNQDFTEEECKRLRQSIRCGFIKAPTVGEFEQKAMSIREAKLNDWFETETLRLSALRDRANEKGRKKELRECVEKLQRLSDPEYRLKELKKAPAFEADPSMDPDYESGDEPAPNVVQADVVSTIDKPRPSGPRDPRDRITRDDNQPVKRDKRTDLPTYVKHDSFGKDHFGSQPSMRKDGLERGWENEYDWKEDGRSNGKSASRAFHMDSQKSSPVEQKRDQGMPFGAPVEQKRDQGMPFGTPVEQIRDQGMPFGSTLPPPPPSPRPVHVPPAPNPPLNLEKEKVWHYQDPQGQIQGPFSFEQLRKWSTLGVFPENLKIWRPGQREQAILLVDALKPPPAWGNPPPPPQQGFGAPVPAHPVDATGKMGTWDAGSAPVRNDWPPREWNGGTPMGEQQQWSQNPVPSPRPDMYHDNGWSQQPPPPQHKSPGWGPSSAPWNNNSNDPRGMHRADSFRGRNQHQTKGGTPCRFYQKGFCRNGESCPFQHQDRN